MPRGDKSSYTGKQKRMAEHTPASHLTMQGDLSPQAQRGKGT
jgi:hypothetical protein